MVKNPFPIDQWQNETLPSSADPVSLIEPSVVLFDDSSSWEALPWLIGLIVVTSIAALGSLLP